LALSTFFLPNTPFYFNLLVLNFCFFIFCRKLQNKQHFKKLDINKIPFLASVSLSPIHYSFSFQKREEAAILPNFSFCTENPFLQHLPVSGLEPKTLGHEPSMLPLQHTLTFLASASLSLIHYSFLFTKREEDAILPN
jgi:hypothetical protein